MTRSLCATLLAGVLLLSACSGGDADTTTDGDALDEVIDAVGENSEVIQDAIAENSEVVEDAIAENSEVVEDAVAENSEVAEAALDDVAAGEPVDITDAEIGAAVEEAVVEVFCENVDGFRMAFEELNTAEVGSDVEAAAVDTMGQLTSEVEELTDGELPELVDSMRLVEDAAIDYLEGDGSNEATAEGDAAAETISSAGDACAELGQ